MDAKELGLLKINYDPQGDVLYCSFGEPREAIGVETDEGIILRQDPETDDVVGITVVDFSKRFQKNPGNFLSFPIKRALRLDVEQCAKR
ncbi:MAG TPA: DUF2283 domain-containing protein [Candidatus Methylomirabilis sp.]|nr:DUF2283 domain-containing protein [Candidatus Methylomirabilis sp.]